MARAHAQYVIFVDEVMLAAPLEKGDHEYFVSRLLPHLQPLSDEDYMEGPAVILHTLARYSYIVYCKEIYWCVEWEPGLLVVRFAPDGPMAWAAFRSPIPNFGGRKPTTEDLRDYDEDAENRQYNLVFRAWDSQFDKQWRKLRSFRPADAKTAKVYHAAFAHVNELGDQLQSRLATKGQFNQWLAAGKRNLKQRAGAGIRAPQER